MDKAIIFGASGQDGFYLTLLLKSYNIQVIDISRSGQGIRGDISDFNFVVRQINENKPKYIFHLAANSTAQHSALFSNHDAISTGTINVLESAKLHCPNAVIFLSGSALQFKNEDFAIDEKSDFEGNSAYSVARIHSVYAGRYYRDVFGLKVYVGYFFNHDSPLRTEKHVNQKIIRAVQRIKNGGDEKLELGNIDVQKEFSFAGDIVEAVWKLVNQQSVFEAVIGSGIAYSIRDWVIYCFDKIGRNWEDFVIKKDLYIPEYKILVSNPSLIKGLGWEPEVNFYQLADMMLKDY